MRSALAIVVAGLLVASCSDIPHDTEGSLQHVREARVVRVGLIAGSIDDEGRGRRLVELVSAATGARPQLAAGAAEEVLTRLEDGELDLVIGTMAAKSSWATKVHMFPPLDPAAEKRPVQLVALARNGENQWIAMLHDQVEEVRSRP